ncbi:ribonuclease E/G [candidate division KSB1 bacterium]
MRRIKKEIVINTTTSETRIAILENGTLNELYIERPENVRMVGDIYKGKVSKVLPGMMAAFIDIGQPQNAFLHFSDISSPFFSYISTSDQPRRTSERRRLADMEVKLKEGQEVNVQVTKEPLAAKGARVTTAVTIPGRFLVLVPNERYIGVSKKIDSFRERKRLKRVAKEILPKNFGLIVRTVASNKDEEILIKDLENLTSTWKEIEKIASKNAAPCLLYKDFSMASSVIRDIFTSDVERVVIDNKKLLRNINTYLKDAAPQLLEKVEYYNLQKPVYEEFNIEKELIKIVDPKVWLPGGGHIVINHTEAMVTIDVNSGKFIGGTNYEANATKVNLQAAREIGRQLRLRDIGGLIVIDFIDLAEEKNRKRVYYEIRNEMRKDRSKTSILPMSEYGLIEMTRQRIRPSLLYTFSDVCPHCRGTGRILSKESIASSIESWIKRFKMSRKERRLVLQVNQELRDYLINGWGNHLFKFMWKFWMKIDIETITELKPDEFRFILKKTGEDITEKFIA